MAMSASEKRQNKVDRIAERYKGMSHARYCADAQTTFNKLRRLQSRVRINDYAWLLACFTCDFVLRSDSDNLGGRIDAGHFLKTKSTLIRFEPNNVHAQCVACNQHLSSNAAKYHERMVEVYGQGEVDRLRALSSVPYTWNRHVLASMVVDWKEQIRHIEKGFK